MPDQTTEEEEIGKLFDASKEVAEFVKQFHDIHRCYLTTCSVCNKFALLLAAKFSQFLASRDALHQSHVGALLGSVKDAVRKSRSPDAPTSEYARFYDDVIDNAAREALTQAHAKWESEHK